jgi:Xaa-Pro aminopeptidase
MQPYLLRRQTLQELLSPGIIILPTAPERIRNNDCLYPYRFDSNFYYLTGFTEPEAVMVQILGEQPCSLLFCRAKHAEQEIWEGFRYGPDQAKDLFGFDKAYNVADIDTHLIALLKNQPRVYFPLGQDASWDQRLMRILNQARAESKGKSVSGEIRDIREPLHEMRLIKDDVEIDILRQAANINATAHRRAMQMTQPGLYEYSIEAELLHEYYRQGSRFLAYSSIVAGGANACVLHYTENNAELKQGELLLIDAGCEIAGYASDITRTFPISGQFTPAQKEVYDIVLAAQLAAIEVMQPGNSCVAPEEVALRILVQGLIDLDLCQGSVEGVIESEAYRQFYMHRIGHWMGLDVHDPSPSKQHGQWRTLRPGMVMTVEPGLYIRPADNVPRHLENIGIRIEDDVLITPTGCEVLTDAAPKTIAEIEALMSRDDAN